MGDRRFDPLFARVRDAEDRTTEIRSLTDEEVIAALGGASRNGDPFLANILATEAQNRSHRSSELSTALGEGIIVMDTRWRVTMQNPAAERMLGWTSGELVGQDPHPLIHPFCRNPDDCHLATVPPLEFFYQNDDALVMRKDGRTIRVAYTITPMLRAGVVDGGVVILRDSSERKRLEEKASEAQDRLATLIGTLPEGILTMDLSGRITYANAAAERILGRAARDIIQRAYYDPTWNFTTPAGEVLPVTALPFMASIASGERILDVRLGVARGDGKTIQLDVNTVPLPDANGAPYALLVSIREVKKRRRSRPTGQAHE